MYYKLPWDEAKTVFYNTVISLLTVALLLATCIWYNLDPELEWAADWS